MLFLSLVLWLQAQATRILIIYSHGHEIRLLSSNSSLISGSSYCPVLVIAFISHARFTTGEDTALRSLIDEYLDAESKLQQVTNPSGTVSTGGLGEPKFNIDLTEFSGPWGR
jgi:hypothetical protein